MKAEYNGQMRIRLCQDKKIQIFLSIVGKKHYGNYWAKMMAPPTEEKNKNTLPVKIILYFYFIVFIIYYLFMVGKMFLILTVYIYKNTIKQQYCKILLQFERTAFNFYNLNYTKMGKH